jgi:hypothetical protein
MYSMVRGRGIARNYVGVAIMNFCRIRSGFMGGGVGKREDTWLWWHGMCCVVVNDETSQAMPWPCPDDFSLHRSVRSDPNLGQLIILILIVVVINNPPRKQV